MREIRFRGQPLTTYGWVYGHYIEIHNPFVTAKRRGLSLTEGAKPEDVLLGPERETVRGFSMVNPETVGQFTGLKDRNGKDIYEGDYLVCKQYLGGNFVEYATERGHVVFDAGAFCLKRKQGVFRAFRCWFDNYKIEIIGNVHENPELLGEQT